MNHSLACEDRLFGRRCEGLGNESDADSVAGNHEEETELVVVEVVSIRGIGRHSPRSAGGVSTKPRPGTTSLRSALSGSHSRRSCGPRSRRSPGGGRIGGRSVTFWRMRGAAGRHWTSSSLPMWGGESGQAGRSRECGVRARGAGVVGGAGSGG